MNLKYSLDITGQSFGRLTALSLVKNRRPTHWLCLCVCGNEVEVLRGSLLSGNTRSCGCIILRHGKTGSKAHKAWVNMRDRCCRKKRRDYQRYGGRGIKVCKRWDLFENFYADMGDPPSGKHSLDRINVNGNYEPSNCRWATAKQQGRNKRNTRWVNFHGKRISLAEAAERSGVSMKLAHQRIFRDGLSLEDALSRKRKQ